MKNTKETFTFFQIFGAINVSANPLEMKSILYYTGGILKLFGMLQDVQIRNWPLPFLFCNVIEERKHGTDWFHKASKRPHLNNATTILFRSGKF
mmetsp:Transcript_17073/g.16506  ORF Transcript_17073/g.16506 Transcript_17073/m.16506 type:complete len:94 (+) Transcript_17073:109-390(+)